MEFLLIEDDTTTRHALAALLRRLGIKVRHAHAVMPAIEALVRLPDVVVLDLPFSDGSGLEVLKMIRETGLESRVAVIIPSSNTTLMTEVKALKPTAIFQRPLNFEDFGAWLCDLFP